jgi:hypothetical protein
MVRAEAPSEACQEPGTLRGSRPPPPSADWFRVWVEAEDGIRTLVHQRLAASRYRYAAYTEVRVSLARWASQTVRIGIGAGDVGRASLVEVAVDDVRIERR